MSGYYQLGGGTGQCEINMIPEHNTAAQPYKESTAQWGYSKNTAVKDRQKKIICRDSRCTILAKKSGKKAIDFWAISVL